MSPNEKSCARFLARVQWRDTRVPAIGDDAVAALSALVGNTCSAVLGSAAAAAEAAQKKKRSKPAAVVHMTTVRVVACTRITAETCVHVLRIALLGVLHHGILLPLSSSGCTRTVGVVDECTLVRVLAKCHLTTLPPDP